MERDVTYKDNYFNVNNNSSFPNSGKNDIAS